MSGSCALHHGFLRSAGRFPDRPAVSLGDEARSYGQLEARARAIAATLKEHRSLGAPLTCVLAQRSFSCFEGILGALCSGHGYVPMLPAYPATRLIKMIDRSESTVLVVDVGGRRVLSEVLAGVQRELLVLTLGFAVDAGLQVQFSRHAFIGEADLLPAQRWVEPTTDPDDVAYLLFTSGSTGEPKGVMVAHRNIARFLDTVVDRYALTENDRFSHMFEVTFDLSLFDMFAAWTVGGCLCVPDMRQRLLPAQYVVDARLSVWFSVPSTARLMKETRTLTPGCFPELRISLFCGEALTVSVGQAWMQSAPKARTENLYGPTEVTLACTAYPMGDAMEAEAEGGVVPIGHPLERMRAKVLDDALHEVPEGGTGELAVAGPQVAFGYWRDAERTAAAFVVPPGERERFYRTGDLVRRPRSPSDPLVFLGRTDSQVKIRGYRVELGEVEAALRTAAGVDDAVALAWPRGGNSVAEGIVGFVTGPNHDVRALLESMRRHLPRYMVPAEIRVLEAFPLNANGKIDRGAMRCALDEE